MDVESALRRDLADSVRSSMNSQILNSAAPDASDPQRVTGFYARLTAPTAPTAEASYSEYARSPSLGVDGIHAGMENECSIVLGVDTYQHAAGIFQSGSGEAGVEAMARRGRMIMASNFVPAAASTISDGNILHSGSDRMRGDSVAAYFSPGLDIIRDIYTRAAQGEVTFNVGFSVGPDGCFQTPELFQTVLQNRAVGITWKFRYQSIGSDSLDGRRLSGVVLSYSDIATIPGIGRERFEPMAFSPIGDSILEFPACET